MQFKTDFEIGQKMFIVTEDAISACVVEAIYLSIEEYYVNTDIYDGFPLVKKENGEYKICNEPERDVFICYTKEEAEKTLAKIIKEQEKQKDLNVLKQLNEKYNLNIDLALIENA